MGKGDKRSKKGKIFKGSFGKTRKRKKGLSRNIKSKTKPPKDQRKQLKAEALKAEAAVVVKAEAVKA